MTSQLEKAKKVIAKFENDEKCFRYEINPTMKNSVFNVMDIFPITSKYIKSEFFLNNKPHFLKDRKLIKKVEKKAKKMISIRMVGDSLTKTPINVLKIIDFLRRELEHEKKIEKVQEKNPLVEKIQERREKKENMTLKK